MPTSNTVQVTTAVNNNATTILPADTTTLKDLFTAGTGGSLVKSIGACSNDTATVELGLFWYNGSTAYQIGHVTIPAASGATVGSKTVTVLDKFSCPATKVDNSGNTILQLLAGHKLQVGVNATVTTAKTVTVFAQGEDFGA